MPHTKRAPVPSALTVRLGTPVERDFWTHYFKASLADVELAIAEVGNNDRAIVDWLARQKRTLHTAPQTTPE
jgi:hypothetical protein